MEVEPAPWWHRSCSSQTITKPEKQIFVSLAETREETSCISIFVYSRCPGTFTFQLMALPITYFEGIKDGEEGR